MASRHLGLDDLNKAALEHFVYQPVSRDMIAYLAEAAHNVITCDSTLMANAASSSSSPSASASASSPASASASVSGPSRPRDMPPTPPRSPEPRSARPVDDSLPTLEEFITQLVVSSNVQVPTLMSTLVYLTRLKSKLQPMARGLRCTTHRIFLASLILAAKYLNDSSPKNKHWANYTHITTDAYSFGFNRTEVNLMEKQLLFLLEWELRISEHDLYRELDHFLEPLRVRIAERHARKLRQREEKRRQQDLYAAAAAAAARYPSPVSSRAHSRSRNASPADHHPRAASAGSVSPPGLTYSSSASSYASSVVSSRQQSRSATPLHVEAAPASAPAEAVEAKPAPPYPYEAHPAATPAAAGPGYGSPVEVVVDAAKQGPPPSARMLPYEISVEQYQQLHEGAAKKRHKRGVWGRLLGGAVTVR